jgi:thiol-disulfide isomerase/thioredoxin
MRLISFLLALLICLPSYASVVKITSAEQFKKEMAIAGPRVILFSAKWCPYCQEFHPIYEKLAGQMSIRFYEIDVDEVGVQVPYLPFIVEVSNWGQKPCLADANPRTEENVTLSILRCIKENL